MTPGLVDAVSPDVAQEVNIIGAEIRANANSSFFILFVFVYFLSHKFVWSVLVTSELIERVVGILVILCLRDK